MLQVARIRKGKSRRLAGAESRKIISQRVFRPCSGRAKIYSSLSENLFEPSVAWPAPAPGSNESSPKAQMNSRPTGTRAGATLRDMLVHPWVSA